LPDLSSTLAGVPIFQAPTGSKNYLFEFID